MKWTWPEMWSSERGGWWRFLVTLALYAVGVVLGMVLFTVVWIGGVKQTVTGQPVYVQDVARLPGTVLIAGTGLAGFLLGLRFVHRKPVACVFTDGRPFKFGLAVQSAGLWVVLWFAGTISLPNGWRTLVRRSGEVPLPWWPLLLLALLFAMAVGRAAEEILFRGYLQTRVAAWVKRPWLAVCISTLIFTLLHRGNMAAYIAVAMFGAAFGVAAIRTGTLAPMIGAHTAHDTLESFWHPNQTNGGATWWDVAFVTVGLSIWLGWLLWATRKTPPDSAPVNSMG
jgi:membrane protease YdiL (CAAX protease family)